MGSENQGGNGGRMLTHSAVSRENYPLSRRDLFKVGLAGAAAVVASRFNPREALAQDDLNPQSLGTRLLGGQTIPAIRMRRTLVDLTRESDRFARSEDRSASAYRHLLTMPLESGEVVRLVVELDPQRGNNFAAAFPSRLDVMTGGGRTEQLSPHIAFLNRVFSEANIQGRVGCFNILAVKQTTQDPTLHRNYDFVTIFLVPYDGLFANSQAINMPGMPIRPVGNPITLGQREYLVIGGNLILDPAVVRARNANNPGTDATFGVRPFLIVE